MININEKNYSNDLVVSNQNLSLALSDVQRVCQSLLTAINSLSSRITQQASEASLLDALPIYQFVSRLRQEFFVGKEDDVQKVLTALNVFAGQKDNLIKQAAKASSSAASVWGESRSLLASLDAALACCRKKYGYVNEYLIRKLFATLSFLNPAASKEEIQRAIEMEREHLECVSLFKELPGSDQEKYDQHLESYFRLLSKFFEFPIVEEELKDKFIEVLEKLDLCLFEEENKLSLQDSCLLRQQAAFLLSRPEWLFYRDRVRAKLFLLEAQEIAAEESAKAKAELELLLLESEQATMYQGASQAVLEPLIERTSSVYLLNALSPSDYIIALSIRIKLYEVLAKESKNPEDILSKILLNFQIANQISIKNKERINFRAWQALAYCRFTFGFYACLCFKNQPQLKNGLQALWDVSKDFGANEKIKHAAALLHSCLDSFKGFPSLTLMISGKFQLLEKFKLMLLQDIYKLAQLYLSEKKMSIESNDVLLQGKDIWSFFTQEFAPSFFSDNLKKAEDIVKTYFALYYIKADKELQSQNYIKAGQMSVVRFLNYGINDHSNEHTFSLVGQKQVLDFVSTAQKFPFMTHIWVHAASDLLLNESKLRLSFIFPDTQLKCAPEGMEFLPGVLVFNDFFRTFMEVLEEFQGKLAYTEIIQDTMRVYANCIYGSEFVKNVFSCDLKYLGTETRSSILNIRRYASLMEILSEIWIDAYRYMDDSLPDFHEEKYDHIFERTMFIINTRMSISQSNQEKVFWSEMGIRIATLRHISLVGRASIDRVQNVYIGLLHAKVMHLNCMEDGEKKLNLLEELFADFPNSKEEIDEVLLPSGFDGSKMDFDKAFVITFSKCMHLIANQQTEAGLALLNKLFDSTNLSSKFKAKISSLKEVSCIQLVEINPLIPHPEKLIREGIEPYKLTLKEDFRSEKPSKSSRAILERSQKELPTSQDRQQEFQGHVSEKKEILDQACQVLQRQEEKKKKKEAKNVSSPLKTNSEITETLTTTSCTTLTHSVTAKKSLSKKAKKIFDLLWQENAPSDASWENKSFRNDIKMRRQQALKLIEALGGRYIPERGHGSHHVAHLPKIEFNNQDMGGLIDFEKGELMITLTSDEELKSYQIKQLRRILIKQGFTPDTVE